MIQETKIYKVLSNFNIYELNRLKKFIQSPYFNINETIELYFETIYSILKSKKERKKTKEDIWSLVYASQAYDDKKFRKLSSDLLKLVESFLAFELFDDNPLHKANYLLESISNKNIEVLFNSGISTANRLSSRQLERSASYYYHLYQKEKSFFSLSSEFEKKAKAKGKKLEFNLSEINMNLDQFFIAEKLKYACTLLSWKNVVKLDDDILFIDEIIKHVKENDYSDTPPIQIYYQIYLTTIEPDDLEHYYRLKDLMKQYIILFPPGEARTIFDSALNYCIRKTNQGKVEFQDELMDLYIQGIENKTLLINNELSPTSFRNICFIALRVGKFDWAKDFVNEYAAYLSPKFRANAVKFNMARINWYEKDYDQVISYLREVEFNDLIYDLTSKSILLMTYYETEEIDPLFALFDSFRTYLNRNKSNMPDRYFYSYINLIKLTRKLSKTFVHEKEKIKLLKEEISTQSMIADKKWLMQKVEELAG